jgi:hypothetical protein
MSEPLDPLTKTEENAIDWLIDNIRYAKQKEFHYVLSDDDFKKLDFGAANLINLMNEGMLKIHINTTKIKRTAKNYYIVSITNDGMEKLRAYETIKQKL